MAFGRVYLVVAPQNSPQIMQMGVVLFLFGESLRAHRLNCRDFPSGLALHAGNRGRFGLSRSHHLVIGSGLAGAGGCRARAILVGLSGSTAPGVVRVECNI